MRVETQVFWLGAAGGALVAAGWLPLGLSALFPVLLVPVCLGLRLVDSGRDALALGLGFGIARYAVAGHVMYALLSYSPLAIAFYLLAVLYVVPFAVMESCGAYWLETKARVPRQVGFAALFALGEYLRSLGALSFPADLLAHGMGSSPAWMGWSGWLGPYHVSFLILLVGALLAEACARVRWRPRRAVGIAGIAAAVWLLPAATDLSLGRRADADVGNPLEIGIVQHCASVEEKHDPCRHEAIWQRLEHLTRRAARGVDLVVWPEAARPGHLIWNPSERLTDPRVEELASAVGVPILYGAVLVTTDGRRVTALYNGAVLVHPDGAEPQWYGKQRLLPFAERVPLAQLFARNPAQRDSGGGGGYLTMLGHFSPGPEPTIFRVGGARIGVLICYEGFYERLARRYRLAGANVLLTLTNDSWWGNSVFPAWHARMASARAQECDLPVVRAATTGVSSATDRHGRLMDSTRLGDLTTLSVEVAPSARPPTLYARTGNVFVLLLCLGIAGTSVAATPRLRRPRPRHPAALPHSSRKPTTSRPRR